MTFIRENSALIVIDVQEGFNDSAFFGPRNNPGAEENIAALISTWQVAGRPIIRVRHDSPKSLSPLNPAHPGNEFHSVSAKIVPDLDIRKTVNSAFYGTPDLHSWLQEHGGQQIVIAGIQTNFCAETTARMGGNLGYDVLFVLDATYTFDLAGPDGAVLTADQLSLATATNLHGGGFARVVTTAELR